MTEGERHREEPGGAVDGEILCDARLGNLELIRSFVEHACQKAGGDPAACFSLKLAVDEACTNLILHGYRQSESGQIAVAFSDQEERIVVTITDRAPSFAPEEIARPLHRTVDRVEYRPDSRLGNRLVLTQRKT